MKLFLLSLLPCSALAGGSVSISIADLGAVNSVESLDIKGNYDCQLNDKVTGKAAYSFNKDRCRPSGLTACSSADTKYGKVLGAVTVDPQEKTANVDATLRNEELGAFSTSYKASESGGVLGAFRWTSNPMPFPFALREPTPMVLSASHNIKTKEGHMTIAAKLNNNLDGKLHLPSQGDAVITLVGSHSPDKDSDVRMSANVLDLAGQGFGKGAVGVTYKRDLDAVASVHGASIRLTTPRVSRHIFVYILGLFLQGSTSRVTLEGKDTGDYAWSLSNTSKRMTLVLSGKGKFAKRGSDKGAASTVSLRQSFRF
ncbi:unnamed protein product [Sphacelaria rigidula]